MHGVVSHCHIFLRGIGLITHRDISAFICTSDLEAPETVTDLQVFSELPLQKAYSPLFVCGFAAGTGIRSFGKEY
jgi:hypothetical protein